MVGARRDRERAIRKMRSVTLAIAAASLYGRHRKSSERNGNDRKYRRQRITAGFLAIFGINDQWSERQQKSHAKGSRKSRAART